MKRFICFTLAILVLLTTAVSLATAAGASGYSFTVGTYETNDFASALSKAQESGSATIKLNKDTSISNSGLSFAAGKNVVFDLGGNTLTCTATGNYVISGIKGNLTFKNGYINVNRGFVVQPGGHLTIDNVDVTVVATNSNARPAVKLQNAGNTHLTIKNSYIKTYGPGESLILIEHSTDGLIDVEGDTTLEYAGVIDNEAQNCAPIALQGTNTDLVLNVGAGSTIIAAGQTDSSATRANSVIVGQTNGNITVNLEKNSTLFVNRTPGASASYFVYKMTNPTVVINDKGANWKISADAAVAGVHMPSISGAQSTLIGWKKGDKIIKATDTYKDVSATADVTLQSLMFSASDFDMLDGASLRTVKGEYGIRFTSKISASLMETLGDSATFGTVIAPTRGHPNLYIGDVLDIKATLFQPEGDHFLFRAAVIMPEDIDARTAYGLTLAASAYIAVTYEDGSTEKYYTDFNQNNVRSMRVIAENLKAQGYANDVVEEILKTFENDEGSLYDSAVLAGYCTVDSLYDGAFNSSVGWKAAGMGYVIRTKDGKLIAIDGGNTADAEGFFKLLSEYSATEKVVVDYWILSHSHADHVNSLIKIAATPELAAKLEIKNIVFYFPTDSKDTSNASNSIMLNNIATQFGANVITPYEGQVINMGETKITFLYVVKNYASYTTSNKLSLIFTVESDKKVMFTGDIYNEGLQYAVNKYGAALKCDILQMPHHFLCDTGYKAFYQAADASAVMLPTCIAGYNAMYNDSSYKNSTNHKANDWAAQNADYVYKAFEGNFEIVI